MLLKTRAWKSYRACKILRGFWRFIGRLINRKLIRKNKNTKVLVILHLFYMESIDEILEYLKNLECYKFDLIVTVMKGMYDKRTLEKLRKFKSEVRIKEFQNKGFDIGPFIDVLGGVVLDEYDIVIKLQTKGVNKDVFAYGQFFRGRDWFLNLFNGVLGAFSVHKTIDVLGNESKYGLVAAKNLVVEDPPHKQELVAETVSKMLDCEITKMKKRRRMADRIKTLDKIKTPKNYKFVAGSCFAIRAECLKPIQDLGLSIRDFREVKRGVFSFGHVMERVICYVVENLGLDYYGNRVDFWRHLKYGRVEKKLRTLSTLNLYKDNRIKIDNLAAIRYLEMAFMKGYTIKNVKVGELVFPDEYNHDKKMTSQEYVDIKEKLKNGYDKSRLIIIDRDKNIIDGKKRVEILKEMEGAEGVIKVLEIDSIPIDVRMIKKFSSKIGYF